MPGASCAQADTGSYMFFTRAVNASSGGLNPINLAGPTNFIFAYGTSTCARLLLATCSSLDPLPTRADPRAGLPQHSEGRV